MFSKRELEGYLKIDNRESPGITPEEAMLAGRGTMPIGRNVLFEASTAKCNHCQRLVVMNPGRTRDRGYCSKCDRYLCDECAAVKAATGECRPISQIIDEHLNKVAKGLIHG